MAITSVAARGTGVSSSSGTTVGVTPTGTIVAGRVAVLTVSTDNTQTTTGTSSNHSTVTDSAGNTWAKLGEYTNGQSAAAAGITVSVWMSQLTTQLTTGTPVTATLSTARVDKAASLYEFSVSGGSTLQLAAANQYGVVNAANGFGSLSFSGLTSKEYLFFRGMGKEANTTTALTVSSGFAAISNTRSRNNSSAVTVYGEFDIVTATGVTSNPTLAVSGDAASVFVVLEEVAPTAVGQDLEQAYAIAEAVGATLAGGYAITATVGADLAQAYSIRQAVGADAAGAYAVLTAAGRDHAVAYAIAAAVSAGVTCSYGMAGAVGQGVSAAYGIAATVSADADVAYSLHEAAGADLVQTYAIHQLAGQDVASGYAITEAVGADLAAAYQVEGVTTVRAPAGAGYERAAAGTRRPAMADATRPDNNNTARPTSSPAGRPGQPGTRRP